MPHNSESAQQHDKRKYGIKDAWGLWEARPFRALESLNFFISTLRIISKFRVTEIK